MRKSMLIICWCLYNSKDLQLQFLVFLFLNIYICIILFAKISDYELLYLFYCYITGETYEGHLYLFIVYNNASLEKYSFYNTSKIKVIFGFVLRRTDDRAWLDQYWVQIIADNNQCSVNAFVALSYNGSCFINVLREAQIYWWLYAVENLLMYFTRVSLTLILLLFL